MTEPLGSHASGNDPFENDPLGDDLSGERFGEAPIGGEYRDYSVIESFVRAAGDLIEPTDDLRPRTIETARRRCRHQRIERRTGGLAVAALLLSLSLPDRIDHSGRFESAYELHRHTAQQAIEGGADASWGLVDAFTEWRRKQAELFSGWHGRPDGTAGMPAE